MRWWPVSREPAKRLRHNAAKLRELLGDVNRVKAALVMTEAESATGNASSNPYLWSRVDLNERLADLNSRVSPTATANAHKAHVIEVLTELNENAMARESVKQE